LLGICLALDQREEGAIAVVDLEAVLRDMAGNLLAGLRIRDLEVPRLEIAALVALPRVDAELASIVHLDGGLFLFRDCHDRE